MREKLKSLLADERLFYSALLIVAVLISFTLGRASVDTPRVSGVVGVPRITITQQDRTTVQHIDEIQDPVNEVVIASRSGTRYHRPDCPGAAQIKPENRIEFANVAAARAAGYTPASNCSGLE